MYYYNPELEKRSKWIKVLSNTDHIVCLHSRDISIPLLNPIRFIECKAYKKLIFVLDYQIHRNILKILSATIWLTGACVEPPLQSQNYIYGWIDVLSKYRKCKPVTFFYTKWVTMSPVMLQKYLKDIDWIKMIIISKNYPNRIF